MSKEREIVEAASRGISKGLAQYAALAATMSEAEVGAEIRRLNAEIARRYEAMRPTKWLRYSMSHLCFHRKRRIREKWRKRLGWSFGAADGSVIPMSECATAIRPFST